MSNPSTRQRLPVELRTLDIRMIRCLVRGPDRKLCALVPLLVQVECDLGKQGTSKDVDSISRTHRIKPHCTQDIPRGHLADIVIPADAIHVISIGIGKDTANPLLRKPGFACIDKQVGGMVHRFIGVVVIVVPSKRGGGLFKEVFQVAWKTLPRPPSIQSVRQHRGERTTSAGADCSPCTLGQTPSCPATGSIRRWHFSLACFQRADRRSSCNFLRGLKINGRPPSYPATPLVRPTHQSKYALSRVQETCSGTYPCCI